MMVSKRSLAAAGLAAALTTIPVAMASAAPTVSVRVESATSTLLARAVTAPSSGSITTGGTPAGQCPADSAAGALDRATHHRWGGSYYKGSGIFVTSILSTSLASSKTSYWGFYVNGRYASAGVCATKLHSGTQLLFAQIPAKGKAPRPIELSGVPARVGVGSPFDVRAYEYGGSGSQKVAVSGLKLAVTRAGHRARVDISRAPTTTPGVYRVAVPSAGRWTIVATGRDAIRSAAVTVSVHG